MQKVVGSNPISRFSSAKGEASHPGASPARTRPHRSSSAYGLG